MSNWIAISESEYNKVWDFVFNNLDFKPHEKKVINLTTPNICFDISSFYNDGFREELYDNLNESALQWFKNVYSGIKMYALNWQHDCYSFNPNFPFEKDEFEEWLIPVFPNGDYLFFLTSDFNNGIFADGINLKFSLWGEDLIKAFEFIKPMILVHPCSPPPVSLASDVQ